MTANRFDGFGTETVQFLADLERNNSREWFAEHREGFDQFLIDPARRFVLALGERLQAIAPEIQAIPAVDKSIFRIHRDTRFSKDKSPYKTHLGIFFWEGAGKKMECPGFYFHLEPRRLLLGGGMHTLTPKQLTNYREQVADPRRGPELESILAEGRRHFSNTIDDAQQPYKRVPRGFAAEHPRAELLKQKGVLLGESTPVPQEIYSPACLDYVFHRFEKMLPLHRWLTEMVNSGTDN